jgi:transcriptional antiterminator RfaH
MLNWYLVQLKPNGHKLAKANLERQGFNTFLPLQNVTKRTAQKFMDRTIPLFAGYSCGAGCGTKFLAKGE